MKKFEFKFQCDQNPEKMDLNVNNTRHCKNCNRNIHDLTRFTPAQFLEFKRKNPDACGYMMVWQPKEINDYIQSQNNSTTSFSWLKKAAVISTPILLSHTSFSQDKVKPNTEQMTLAKNNQDNHTEFQLRDQNNDPIVEISFDIFAGTELLEKIQPDSTGKISISHTRYIKYNSIRIVNTTLKIEQTVTLQKSGICQVWKIDMEEMQKTNYDFQFVYRDKNNKPIYLTKVDMILYDSTNQQIGIVELKTNINGYTNLNAENTEKVKYISFVLYTRHGRKTAYVSMNELKAKEVNVIEVNRKFKAMIAGYF